MTIKSKEKRKRNWRRAKLDLWQTNHQSPRSLHLVPKSVTARYIFSLFSELFFSRAKFCSQCSSLLNPLPSLRWCYTRRLATTIFSSTKSCNIVATLFRIVPTLLRIVSCKRSEILRKSASRIDISTTNGVATVKSVLISWNVPPLSGSLRLPSCSSIANFDDHGNEKKLFSVQRGLMNTQLLLNSKM